MAVEAIVCWSWPPRLTISVSNWDIAFHRI
jgi:hypothetical protein